MFYLPRNFLQTPCGRYYALALLAEHSCFSTGCLHCWFVFLSNIIQTGGIPPCWWSHLECRFISVPYLAGRFCQQFIPESIKHNDSNKIIVKVQVFWDVTLCCSVFPKVSKVLSTWTWRHSVCLNIGRCKPTQHIVTPQRTWIFSNNTVVKETSNLM